MFISGYTEESFAQYNTLDCGAAFLQKPFSPVELALKVREVLDN
jgi:hypothetical protein